jgi:murein DD-endopeptidase MepM/ murein hydrolase activator NlpD
MSSFLNRTVLMLAASTALVGPSTVAFAREVPVQLALMQATGGSYTVQRGDTLTGISKKVGVSPEALSEANDLGAGGRIDAGMKLKVPGGTGSAPGRAQAAGRVVTVSSGPSTYVVRSGDTVDEIADRMGMSRKALADLNGLKSPYALSVGRKLKGPPETRKAYVVADGDSLEAVARRFSVTSKALAAENGLRTSAALRSGQKLTLPDGYRDRGPVRSTPAPAPKPPAPVREARPETVREAAEPTLAAAEEAPRDKVSTRTLAGGKVISVKGKPATYTVRKGDTVDEIANRMGLTRKELATLNGLKSPYALKPGQVLKGPAGTQKAYVATQGDTLSVVARRFGITSKALAATNGLKATAPLRTGQRLILPDGVRDRGPIRETVRTPAPPATGPAPTVKPPATEAEAPLEAPLEDPATRAPTLRTEPGQGSPPPVTVPPPAPSPVPVTPPPRVLPLPVPVPQVAAPKPVLPLPSPPPVVRTTPPQSVTPAPVRPPPPRTSPPVVTPTPAPPAPRPQSGGFTPPPTASTTPLTEAQITALGKGRFVWPIRGEILSDFGPKGTGQRNDGVNIRAARGAPVRASAAGEVVYAGDQVPGFGNLVLVKHPDGWVTAYAHMSNVDVKIQQKVLQGQQIGEAGDTGGVSEPQLHFEIRYAPTPAERARPVAPTLLLPR